MRVRHPNAVRETVDDVDDRVTLGGDTYAVDADDCVDVPERAAVAWADRYDLDVADIAVDGEAAESGTDDDESGDVAPGDTICTCDVNGACDACGGDCPTVKTDHEVCGRERPCPYHDD